PIESHPQVVTHDLHPAVVAPVQPGKNGVAREKLCPPFKRLWGLDTERLGAFHYRSPRVRSENISPEFCARITPADIHDEANRFPALLPSLAGKTKNYVEGRADAGPHAFFRGLVDRLHFLEILVHQSEHLRRGRFRAVTNLRETGSPQEPQFIHAEPGHQVCRGLDAPVEFRTAAHQTLGDRKRT